MGMHKYVKNVKDARCRIIFWWIPGSKPNARSDAAYFYNYHLLCVLEF